MKELARRPQDDGGAALVQEWVIAITREEGRLKYRVDNDQLHRLIPFMTLRGCLLFSDALEEL